MTFPCSFFAKTLCFQLPKPFRKVLNLQISQSLQQQDSVVFSSSASTGVCLAPVPLPFILNVGEAL